MNLPRLLILGFAFIISASLQATDIDLRTYDYSKADSIAVNLNKKFLSVADLSAELTRNLTTEHEKFRAIFRWVTDNIAYSYSQMSTNPENVLRTKKAVCSGYSELLRELCHLSNIDCEVVNGYAKSFTSDIRKFDRTNHAWNAVELYGKWYLVDATWAAGYVNGAKFTRSYDEFYFLTPPEKFLLTHLPEYDDWRLTNATMTLRDFEQRPIYFRSFFDLQVEELKREKGVIGNTISYKFKCSVPVERINLKIDRESNFRKVEFTEIDGICEINYKITGSVKGTAYLYVNGQCILGFMRN